MVNLTLIGKHPNETHKCTCMLAHLLYYASKKTNYLIQFGLGYLLTNQVIKDVPPMATYPSRCLDTLTANDLATRILSKNQQQSDQHWNQ